MKKTPNLFKALIIFIVYVTAAKIGLSLDAVSGFASLVWPPTGIAIAVMLLYGVAYLPAIALGAFAANLSAGAPVPVAAGIGAGNALEAFVAAWLLLRDGRFRHALDDARSVLAFIGLAAGVSTLVSATIGVTSLWLGGVIPLETYRFTWTAWWVGDVFGALVIAPFLLVWLGRPMDWEILRRQAAEIAAMLAIFGTAAAFMFGGGGPSLISPTAASYFMMIPLVWAGVRFGMRGATASIFVFSVLAVSATAAGRGPFVAGTLIEGLASLHLFIGASSIIALFLGSAHDGRLRADAGRAALQREVLDQARYLRTIIDAAPVGIMLLDSRQDLLQVNRAGLKMLEAKAESRLLGKPMRSFTLEKDRKAFEDLLGRVLSGSSGESRLAIAGLKGTPLTLDVKMVPLRGSDGVIMAGLGIFSDVTRDVERESLLTSRNEELERLNRILIGRETKMVEMKKELEELRRKP